MFVYLVGDEIKTISSKAYALPFGSFDKRIYQKDVTKIPAKYMMFNGKKVVDARHYKRFYIDNSGKKHLVKLDKTWQRLYCRFDDELIRDSNNKWRIKHIDLKLKEYREAAVNNTLEIIHSKLGHKLLYHILYNNDILEAVRDIITNFINNLYNTNDISEIDKQCDEVVTKLEELNL